MHSTNILSCITIDGPSAAGKGTISRALAAACNYYYLDSGILYRAIAYLLSRECSEEVIRKKDIPLTVLEESAARLEYTWTPQGARIIVDAHDISACLRTSTIDWLSSHISTYPPVRKVLRDVQRNIGKTYPLVADGRDCGTRVFPDASWKFFITAPLSVRAQRALSDDKRTHTALSYEIVYKELLARDIQDISRRHDPLMPAADAVIIDTAHLTVEQAVSLLLTKIHK